MNIFIQNVISRVKAIELINKKIVGCKNNNYLLLEHNMPYIDAINKSSNNKIKYVILQSNREGYKVR
ncbi:MAG: hypothetical protein IJE05_00855 [Clostridia bacterium]|nr:hypothetical protein [Clostridia bacterium]